MRKIFFTFFIYFMFLATLVIASDTTDENDVDLYNIIPQDNFTSDNSMEGYYFNNRFDDKEIIEKWNNREFLRLYEEPCNKNNFEACYKLGEVYEFGKGVPIDYNKAFNYYTKSCQQGYKKGCNVVGIMYKEGKGVEKDYSQAKEYFAKQCLRGYAPSCYNIANMYKYGEGVPVDYYIAKAWFSSYCYYSDIKDCRSIKEVKEIEEEEYYASYRNANPSPYYRYDNTYMPYQYRTGLNFFSSSNKMINNFLNHFQYSTNFAVSRYNMIAPSLGLPVGQFDNIRGTVNNFSNFGRNGGFNFIGR